MAEAGVELSSREHPLYTQYLPKWEFYLESVKGGEDYTKNENNLFTHRLESSSDDYEDRKERGYFLNYCAVIPQIYADYIFKEKVVRPADVNLTEFRNDVDGRGTSLVAFMKKVSILSSIFGHIHIVIDMPKIDKTKSVTRKVVKDEKLRPLLSIVYPQDLKDWSVDANGVLNWVLIKSIIYEDEDPHAERIEKELYKIISRDTYEVVDKDGVAVESGTNELGEVYLVTCYNKDVDLDLIGESQLTDIAYINRTIFNWCSNIDEMIERQTFSQLICPDDGTLSEADADSNPLKKIGSSHIFTFPSDTGHPPNFISPDTTQIEIIWKMITEHVKEIWRLAGLKNSDEGGVATSQRSGVSMQFSFLDINSALASKAASLEIVENEINKFCYKWMGKTDVPPSVHYPSSFDVLSLTETIETTFRIVTANISKTLNKHLLKSIVSKALPVIPEDVKEMIESEIEAGDGTITVPVKGSNFQGDEKTDVSASQQSLKGSEKEIEKKNKEVKKGKKE